MKDGVGEYTDDQLRVMRLQSDAVGHLAGRLLACRTEVERLHRERDAFAYALRLALCGRPVRNADELFASYDRDTAAAMEGSTTVRLNKEDSLRAAELLLDPPEPTDALRRLMRGEEGA